MGRTAMNTEPPAVDGLEFIDGVVEKIERDEDEGGRAGRYVKLAHKDGTVVTRYIHLDTVGSDLREGDRVFGGQVRATTKGEEDTDAAIKHFSTILGIVEENYANDVDPDKAVYAVLAHWAFRAAVERARQTGLLLKMSE